MFKSGLSCMAVTFLIWGLQPLYWSLSGGMDTMFLMLWRICMASVCCFIILKAQGKLPVLEAAFKNKETLKREVPAALFLAVDWFVYLFAIKAGKVQEVGFGYYLMPIVIFSFGAFIYREKITKYHVIVLILVAIGISTSVRGFGEFPWAAAVLASAFAVYSAIKKGMTEDGIITTSMEIFMMFPFALIGLLVFYRGENGLAGMSLMDKLYVVGAGVVTATPMLFYSLGVKKLSMFTTALCHYVSPTLSILCGVILGEPLTKEKLICFAFIWAGIIVYTVNLYRMTNQKVKAQ
ncbi:MAG: EamA family transporter [Lachnospiraceae bacterium]|nr:EamA family transporter [Lachnospiraceae bacterium]